MSTKNYEITKAVMARQAFQRRCSSITMGKMKKVQERIWLKLLQPLDKTLDSEERIKEIEKIEEDNLILRKGCFLEMLRH